MRAVKSLLVMGLAVLTVVEAGKHHRKPTAKTTLVTVHTADLLLHGPGELRESESPVDVLAEDESFAATETNFKPKAAQDGNAPNALQGGSAHNKLEDSHSHNKLEGSHSFSRLKDSNAPNALQSESNLNKLQDSHPPNSLQDSHTPTHNDVPTPEDSSSFHIEVKRAPRIHARQIHNQTSKPVIDFPLPDGPAGYSAPVTTSHPISHFAFPNGPAGFTSSNPTTITTATANGTAISVVAYPDGPAGYTPSHPHARPTWTTQPLSKIASTTWTLQCTGTDLFTKTRTCFSDKDTDLTGTWCAANCKCRKSGCMSCDTSKAAGCDKDVLTDTCKAVVRDWKCVCVGSNGAESTC